MVEYEVTQHQLIGVVVSSEKIDLPEKREKNVAMYNIHSLMKLVTTSVASDNRADHRIGVKGKLGDAVVLNSEFIHLCI